LPPEGENEISSMTNEPKKGDAASFAPDLGTPEAPAAVATATAPEAADTVGQGMGDPSRFTPTLVEPVRLVTHKYWFGLFPGAPVEAIVLAGQSFAKFVKLRWENTDTGENGLDHGHRGIVVGVTLEFLEALCEVLPRKIVRWASAPGGAGDEVGKGTILPEELAMRKGRRGGVVTVRTQEMIAELRKNKLPCMEHVPMQGDEPLARYVFCVPAPGGQRAAGEVLPKPISETGIVFPD
jgi:hypothetical protein